MGRLLLLCLLLAACTGRSAPQDRGVPIWPDLRPDHRRAGDGPRDGTAALDQPLVDRSVVEASPHDYRADAPAKPWQKVALLTAEDLHGVACVSGHVFAVGAQGTILHRAPGGVFTPQLAPAGATDPTTTLYTVSFADASYGVAAGNGSQIWQTVDLGTTWTIAPQCSAYLFDTFYALHLAGAQEGFAAGVASGGAGGGTKYFNPPGLSWVCSSPTFPGKTFYDVFRQGNRGWVVGDTGGTIYRSEDQGLSWNPVPAGSSNVLRGVFFTSAAAGLAVGEAGTIVRSVDGTGLSWAAVSSPTAAALRDVFFWDAQNGWAVGVGGTILHSDDGGATWSAQASGVTSRVEAVCFTSSTEGWAVGEKGLLLHTTSGGQ